MIFDLVKIKSFLKAASVFFCSGVAIGKAGPAQALVSTHALWQASYGAIFAGQTLDSWQIAGIFIGLLGVFSISYIDHLANRAVQNKKLGELQL